MFGLRFLTSGRRRRGPAAAERAPTSAKAPTRYPAAPPAALTSIRLGLPREARALRRRDVPLVFDRVFLPSLIIDHTELILRQRGACGEEGFALWAGTLAAGDAFVSTVVLPAVESSHKFRGEISPATAAALFEELDFLDLVPVAQIHSHPRAAFLSAIDAERPLVAVPGFLSIVVPDFGFVDLTDVRLWRAYAFKRRDRWTELDEVERRRRLIIDPSLLRID